MPENTSATNSTVSDVDVSGFEAFQNVEATIQSIPDTFDDERFAYVQAVKQLKPRYEHTANEWILGELRGNSTFRDSLVDLILEDRVKNDPEFSRLWNSDDPKIDEWRQEQYKNLSHQVVDSVSRNAYKGELTKERLVNHQAYLAGKIPEYGISNPLAVLGSAPEEFSQWFDPKDIKNNGVSDREVRMLYDNDEDFKRATIRTQLRNFEQALGNRANQGVYDPNVNSSEYAKAYAIYNRFGSEALTDYTNILQHYVPGASTQDRRVIDALWRFRDSPQYRDVDIFDYATKFITGHTGIKLEANDTLAPFQNHIQRAAEKYDIDPALLAGLIMQESSGRVNARSPKNAVGLTQLIPATAQELGMIVNERVDERLNPEKSIMGGAHYLRKMLDEFDGDEAKALAAYNAGPGGLRNILKRAEEQGKDWTEVIGEGFYSETADYLPKVQGYRDRYGEFTETIDALVFDVREPIQAKPRDWNRLTASSYYTPENEHAQEDVTRLRNFVASHLNMHGEGVNMDIVNRELSLENIGSELNHTDLAKAFSTMYEDHRQESPPVYSGSGYYTYRTDFPKNYAAFAYNVIEHSLRDEEFGFQDVVATLAANAPDIEEDEFGNIRYIFDYNELQKPENLHLKILADGLEAHTMGDAIYTRAGARVVIEPEKQARRDREYAQHILFKSEPRPIIDEGMNIVGFEENIPNNAWNTFAGGAIGFTNIIPEVVSGVVAGWGGNFAEAIGASDNVIQWFDEGRHKNRDYYSGTLVDFTDPVWQPFGMPFSATDIGVAGGTLLGYLAGIKMLGKGAFAAAGQVGALTRGGAYATKELFSGISSIRRHQNFREFYAAAGGSGSRAYRDFLKTKQAVLKDKPYGVWPTFVVGSAAIETATDPQYSLFGLLHDVVARDVNNKVQNGEWNLDRTYRTSGHITRWAMDFAAGEMLGLLFDGAIGVTKLANDHTFRALKGRPKLGLEYDAASGRYLPESESSYNTWGGTRKYLFPEIQRFAYNVRNSMDDITEGNIREAANRYIRAKGIGPQNFDEDELVYSATFNNEIRVANQGRLRDEGGLGLFPEEDSYVGDHRIISRNTETGEVTIEYKVHDWETDELRRTETFTIKENDLAGTQADVVAKFVSESNDFMHTMRTDIRAIIEESNERFGGTAKMDSSQMDDLADDIYQEFLDNVAKQTYSFIGKGRNWNAETFARQLEEYPGDIVDLTPINFNGESTVSRAEAQILKNRYPGSHVIPVGDGTYKVYQNDPALWRFDLANRIRQYTNQSDTFEGNVNRHVSRYGLDYGRVEDEADITTVIETLESTQGVGVRVSGREGVISGFSSKGWEVRWDDGTDDVFGTIRGVDGLPERPPDIKTRAGRTTTDATGTPTARGAVDYDEAGRAIEEDVAPVTVRGEGTEESKAQQRVLDTRSADEIMESAAQTDRASRQAELDEVFQDPEAIVQQRITRVKELMSEGRHDEADEVIREIADIRRGPEQRDTPVHEMPGVVRLQEIVDQDRAAYEAYRAARDAEPDDISRLQTHYRDRLIEGLRTRNDENILKDIQTLRAMGMSTDEIDELIQANAVGDAQLTNYYRNFNRSQEFGDSVTDDLLASRVDSKRAERINDEAFQALDENTKTQMIEQADLLASAKGVDEPQRLIDTNDPEITAARSWETSNERFRDNRTNEDGLSPKDYAVRLAEDLGTGTVRDIPKLQKTRANGTEKVPIRTITHADLIGTDGKITPIKNSKGLVVRVEPLDGGLPYYAIGRKNNIKGFPSRFVADQNGGVIPNQEWAFINPNVTQRPDGQLKRFKPHTLENGEVVYREHAYGTHVLNIQNPVRVDKYDLTGRTLKGTDGKKMVVKGMRTHEVLTPDRVFKHHVDAIEIRDPGSSRVMYRPVSPEGQVFRHGKPVSDPGDQRVPHITFETLDEPLNAGEALARMSRANEKKVYNHAWLAIPGMITTGGIGIDENGELTTAAKVGLALGAIGIGSVMIRSMRGNFKIRSGYDKLDPKYKQTFDQFDWRKIDKDGTPIRSKLTDEESAMFNRLQGVPKEDYAMLHNIMDGYHDRGIVRGHIGLSSEEIPEMSARMRTYRDEQYQHWSTGFGEDGEISPLTARLDQRARQEVEVIGLQLNPESTDLVTMHHIGHSFRESTGVLHRPVSWARIQKTPDGRLLLDELQVDNALQKGEFGISGDVNRDLYSSVLDEVVERAIRESDGEFYVTRGNMQASRYGDNPTAIVLRDTANQQIRDRIHELREETPDVIIRDADSIESARRMTDMRQGYVYDPENPNRLGTLIGETTDSRTELGRAARSFGNSVRTHLDFMEALSQPGVEGTYGKFSIRAVDDGYGIRLSNEALERQAIDEFYESNVIARRSFPLKDEFEDFLKDGLQTKGVMNFYDNTLPNVIRKRYGAEIVDAMGSPKDAYDSPGEAFHKVIVTEEGLRNARNKTGKRINWELIPGSAALAGMAYAAYNMEHIGQQPGTDTEIEKAGLGFITTVLMIAAAAGMARGKFRTKVGGNIKGKVRSNPANVVDRTDAKALEIDGARMDRRHLHELNAHINPNDPSSLRRMDGFWRGLRTAMKAGRNINEWFSDSAYTQAGVQHLRKISEAIKTATGTRGRVVTDDIINYLLEANNAPAKLMAKLDTRFNDTLGYGQGAFREFGDTKGAQFVNGVLNEPIPAQEARVLFGDAVTRLMNRGATMNEGRPIVKTDIPPNIRQQYDGEGGEFLQRLDDAMLRDKEMMDYIDTLHYGYREVRKEYLGLLSGEMGRRMVRFRNRPDVPMDSYKVGDANFTHEDVMRLLEDWVTDNRMLTYRDFLKTLDNPDERQLMRVMKTKSNIMFGDIVDIQNMRRRFTDLEGRYVPQMVDFDKVNAARQRYVDDATSRPEIMDETGVSTPEDYAQRMMYQDFKALNQVGDGRGLIGFNEETLSLSTQRFETVDKARQKLVSIIRNGATNRIQEEWDQIFGDRQLTNELMEEMGFVRRVTDAEGKTEFELRQPENLEVSEDIFEIANNTRFQDYYNRVMIDPAIKKSNFLENPRKFHLPLSWMKTDPADVWKSYSFDTGGRLHSLRHGIYKGDDFERNFMEPMMSAMQRVGYTPEQADNTVTRVREMHDTQFGIMRELAGLSTSEANTKLHRMRTTNAMLQTYRNIDYSKRTYGFKYLNWFQLLVSTLPMTSSRTLAAAMGLGPDALSQGGLKQLEGMFKDLHIIKEKDLSFRFDIQPGDPTGEHGNISSWAHKNSQRLADTVSDFSIEKSALRLFGVDVGNSSRIFRMATSSFHDTNVMNTAMNGWAFMAKAQEIARIARQMQLQGIQPDQVYRAADGSQHGWEAIYRQLEDVGVSRHKMLNITDADGNPRRVSEADYFIEKEAKMSAWMDRMKRNERVSINDFEGNHADIIENMWHFATETYHGTNRVMRPEKWNTPLGRTMAMYASFTFNIGMQNVKQRMLDPVNLWITRYGTDADGNQQIGKMQLPALMKVIRNGDEDALRAAGIVNPKMAIAEFPLDSIDAMRRGVAGIGFGIATYTTLDVMRDIYSYPVQAALGIPEEERFRRTRLVLQDGIINPYASPAHQVSMGDLFGGEADAQDMMRLIAWGIGKVGQSSYGGMYLSPFDSVSKYGFRGVGGLAPSVGIADRFASDIVSLIKPPLTMNFDEMPGESAKFLMNNLPVIGSNVFTESRSAARERINAYHKSLNEN